MQSDAPWISSPAAKMVCSFAFLNSAIAKFACLMMNAILKILSVEDPEAIGILAGEGVIDQVVFTSMCENIPGALEQTNMMIDYMDFLQLADKLPDVDFSRLHSLPTQSATCLQV